MDHVSIIGIDIAKRRFSVHAATADGVPVFRKTLTRNQFLSFIAEQKPCRMVLEACGGAHYWGRQIREAGHECLLIPPAYVKPFVKRQKNDANDAAAIVEAAQRPTMRFVPVKTEDAQADAMLFRTRALLVRQRTQVVNALRGHLAEFGIIAAQGLAGVGALQDRLAEAEEQLPVLALSNAALLFDQIDQLQDKIKDLDRDIRTRVRQREALQRLMTIPGVGPIGAMAVAAFAPPMESFQCGRDFAAWVGLTPRQNSTGGRQRLGRITKMGQRDLRRLLVLGATAVLRHQRKDQLQAHPWLRRMMAEKPPKVVAVALANKMARMIWALSIRQETYRAPVITTNAA